MNLYMVRSCADDEQDAEGRLYVVIAPEPKAAAELASKWEHDRDSTSFKIESEAPGHFPGPAKVLGYCGPGAWTWQRS